MKNLSGSVASASKTVQQVDERKHNLVALLTKLTVEGKLAWISFQEVFSADWKERKLFFTFPKTGQPMLWIKDPKSGKLLVEVAGVNRGTRALMWDLHVAQYGAGASEDSEDDQEWMRQHAPSHRSSETRELNRLLAEH